MHSAYKEIKYNVSVKIHSFDSQNFPPYFGTMSDKPREQFLQDIAIIESNTQ